MKSNAAMVQVLILWCCQLLFSLSLDISLTFSSIFCASEYPHWMSLNSNMNNFLFATKEECCQKHKCTKSEFWWPDVESSENKCNYSTGKTYIFCYISLSSLWYLVFIVTVISHFSCFTLRLSWLDVSKLKHCQLFICKWTGLLCTPWMCKDWILVPWCYIEWTWMQVWERCVFYCL